MIIADRNNKKLALKIGLQDFKKGLTFFSNEEDFLQVGSWNYDQGKHLLAHIHKEFPRHISRTQEFIFVLRGKLKASFYDEQEQFITDVFIDTNEGLINLAGGHGYEILADDTIVIEVKNGPYPGPDSDRKRI